MQMVNGWSVLAHPLFLDQLEKLVEAVETVKAKEPDDYRKNANTKLLAAIIKLVFETIPADPTATTYRQVPRLEMCISTGSCQIRQRALPPVLSLRYTFESHHLRLGE